LYASIGILKKLCVHLFLITLVVVLGATGYHFLYPEESLHRLLYMTTITLSTVGYGDIFDIQHNPLAIYYTIVLMIIGMGVVLYSISAVTALFIEGNILQVLSQRKLDKRIKEMKDHYIICGAGQTGIHVIREMLHANKSLVVIESHLPVIAAIKEEFKNLLIIVGDATSDQVLDEANIQNALGIVVALANDKDNLFLTLSSRLRNPQLKIVSKAVELSLIDKLKIAGADYVVSPNFIGGIRIASEMLHPHVSNFLDNIFRESNKTIGLGEVIVGNSSNCINKSLADMNIFKNCQLNIIAYAKKSNPQDYIYNPPQETVVEEGDILIFIGTNHQQEKMNELFT